MTKNWLIHSPKESVENLASTIIFRCYELRLYVRPPYCSFHFTIFVPNAENTQLTQYYQLHSETVCGARFLCIIFPRFLSYLVVMDATVSVFFKNLFWTDTAHFWDNLKIETFGMSSIVSKLTYFMFNIIKQLATFHGCTLNIVHWCILSTFVWSIVYEVYTRSMKVRWQLMQLQNWPW